MASYEIFKEKSQTIRQPATANLMIDSADRPFTLSSGTKYYQQSPFDFQIQAKQSLLNGFFHRIGTSEGVLEWDIPNINSATSTNSFLFDMSGQTFSTTIAEGFYTVQDLLQEIPWAMSTLCSTVNVSYGNFSTIPFFNGNYYALRNFSGVPFVLQNSPLTNLIFTPGAQSASNITKVYKPQIDLRPFRYIDFVSENLTYNQNLKDADTTNQPRNVLNRWYFDWDNPPDIDGFGYPILQGYIPFRQRRLYNPPKQIRWNNEMPIGNLGFQVYGDNGSNLSYLSTNSLNTSFPPWNTTNWLMTLQVSED